MRLRTVEELFDRQSLIRCIEANGKILLDEKQMTLQDLFSAVVAIKRMQEESGMVFVKPQIRIPNEN